MSQQGKRKPKSLLDLFK